MDESSPSRRPKLKGTRLPTPINPEILNQLQDVVMRNIEIALEEARQKRLPYWHDKVKGLVYAVERDPAQTFIIPQREMIHDFLQQTLTGEIRFDETAGTSAVAHASVQLPRDPSETSDGIEFLDIPFDILYPWSQEKADAAEEDRYNEND